MRLTKWEIEQRLKASASQLEPLRIEFLSEQPTGVTSDVSVALLKISISGSKPYFARTEILPVANPKIVKEKCEAFLYYINQPANKNDNFIPLIIAPYIGKKQSDILADSGISWIDLCGNMRIQVPGKMYIERTGNKNKFPDTAPIKKIFQGNSSLISRALLLKPGGFQSLYELADFINNRNANVALSTISRVLKSLEDDLLVSKGEGLIVAKDREKLLDRLSEGYINSTKRKDARVYKFAVEKIEKLFFSLFENNIDYAAFGFYAAQIKNLAVTNQMSIFAKDIEQVKKAPDYGGARLVPDAEFGNLDIIETRDACVWFNADIKPKMAIVDDLELYLEMMAEVPRGPKVAEKLRPVILKGPSNE
ncbi:MAG: winged helix-turn-helix domain-containing protein [Planctomycetes bacterium]|nr:winged helix-turn-helix domain-containing protein [Planctomycetota bacterium]